MVTSAMFLLKVSVCLFAFYILYLTVFRYSTFFGVNRAYLLFALIASFGIPIINFPAFENQFAFYPGSLPASFTESESLVTVDSNAAKGNPLSLSLILTVIYFLGVALMFTRALAFVIRIMQLKNGSEIQLTNGFTIVKANVSQPFSFFNLIFLPERETNSLIIEHEKVHVMQFHWFDLMLVEVASIVLWFNPLVVLYQREIKLQHEYLADANTVLRGVSVEEYLKCMLAHIYSKNFSYPINQFYSKSLKQRINMLTKRKTSRKFSIMYLLIVPVLSLLLFSFSKKSMSNPDVDVLETAVYEANVQDENMPSMSPVESKSARISSGYGERMHPVLKVKKFHTGLDLILPEGEIVLSTANGTVVESGSDDKRGIYLVIKHTDMFSTAYFHFKNTIVKKGNTIEKGQTIGYIGSTGMATVPHLHYEVIKNGKQVDPIDYMPK
jgi:beta-lactamase regulating signal transducer with metallopeptidase domain